jgi:hypothetical protein
MSHGHIRIHKIHHSLNLGEAITFPFIVFSMISHEGCTQMLFCLKTPKLGVLKFSKLGLSTLWRPIVSCLNLWLKWSLKQSCSTCQELFNDMSHATYTQVNQGDSRLLVVGSQIGTLTFSLSFGHNFCFKYPNGSCETISNIQVSRYFQCYK